MCSCTSRSHYNHQDVKERVHGGPCTLADLWLLVNALQVQKQTKHTLTHTQMTVHPHSSVSQHHAGVKNTGGKTPLATQSKTQTTETYMPKSIQDLLLSQIRCGHWGSTPPKRSTSQSIYRNQIWHIIYCSVHQIQNTVISLESLFGPVPTERGVPLRSLC